MSRLGDIREALAANLSSLSGWQISAYVLADPTPPTIQIMPSEISYDLAMARGLDQLTLVLEVFVPVTVDSQKALDAVLESDIKTAAELNGTLGGLVGGLRVTEMTGYGVYTRPDGTSVLGCRLPVEIHLHG